MSVVVEEDVAVSQRDQPDTLPERCLRGEVSVVASAVVIMGQDENVDQPQSGEVKSRRRRERRGQRQRT